MASSPKPPTPVDPTKVIQAQSDANRVNRNTPFGDQTYGPNGLTTSLSPGMQNIFGNVMQAGGQTPQPLRQANTGGLQNAIMNKVSQRYQNPNQGGIQSMGGQKGSQSPMPAVGGTTGSMNGAFNHMLQNINQGPFAGGIAGGMGQQQGGLQAMGPGGAFGGISAALNGMGTQMPPQQGGISGPNFPGMQVGPGGLMPGAMPGNAPMQGPIRGLPGMRPS